MPVVVVVTARDLTEEARQRLNGGVARIVAKRGYGTLQLLAEVGRALAACIASREDAAG